MKTGNDSLIQSTSQSNQGLIFIHEDTVIHSDDGSLALSSLLNFNNFVSSFYTKHNNVICYELNRGISAILVIGELQRTVEQGSTILKLLEKIGIHDISDEKISSILGIQFIRTPPKKDFDKKLQNMLDNLGGKNYD